MSVDHIINPELLNHTRAILGGFQKRAFVPSGDPGMGGAPPGGGGAPPGGGDPSMGGGAPPGGDPSGGGGAPPPDPMVQQLQQQLQQMQQQMQQMQAGGGGAGAGGAGGAGGALKPKVDVNSVLLQILKIQARIADQLGVKIPASEMVVNQQDLGQLAAATQSGAPMPGMDPNLGGGGGGGGDPAAGGAGAIGGMPPMDPMQGAGQPGGAQKAGSYRPQGEAFDTTGFATTCSRAQMIAQIRSNARKAS